MRVRELMNYLTEFMDNKGKLGTGLGDASVFMHVGGHLEEIKRKLERDKDRRKHAVSNEKKGK